MQHPKLSRSSVRDPIRRRRFSWRAAFFTLNVVGLALIFWHVCAARPPSGKLAATLISPFEGESPTDIHRVVVRLSAPLDPGTVKDDALTLAPSVPGKVALKGDQDLHLRLARPLRKATRYQVRISRKLCGLRGERPDGELLYFTTVPLTVEDVSQAKIEAGRSSVIAIRFSGPVDPRELARHLKLRDPDNRPVSFTLVGSKPDATVRIRIPRVDSEQVQVLISGELTGTDGPLPLGNRSLHIVKVSTKLRFLGMRARYRRSRPCVEIRANSPIAPSAAKLFVKIDPPVVHTFDADDQGLRILGKFKPGQRYAVTLKAGLLADAAGTLDKELTRAVWFPDRPKSLRFAFGSGYLSPRGLLKVPIRSVNVKSAKLAVRRLYASNLVEYALRSDGETPWSLATGLGDREIRIEDRRNEDVETLVDLRAPAGADPRGVFGLMVRRPGDYWTRDSAVIVVTDLGLSARLAERRALVWVTSIASARPAAGVEVTVYSDRRQKMGVALSDSNGIADVKLRQVPAGEEPALVVAARTGELTYMTLARNCRSRGHASASGRPYLSKGYEVFVFPERGVYRAGDTARISAFVRGVANETPPPMPLELVVKKPNGRELLRKSVMSDRAGRLVTDVAIPRGAPGGRYRAAYHLPGKQEPLDGTHFRVADYVPRTLRMKLTAPVEPLAASRPLEIRARVEHLFGDAACGLKTTCRARYRAAGFRPQGWSSYGFGDGREKTGTSRLDLPEKKLDESGNAAFELKTPKVAAQAAIRVDVEVEVREQGGRALTEMLSRRLDPWPFYVGIKAPETEVVPGEAASFSLAAVRPDGKPCAKGRRFTAALCRVSFSNVLRRRGSGRLEYEWTRHETLVAKTEGHFAQGLAQVTLTPQHAGPHRLTAECAGGCAATADFYVSGSGPQWAVADPEQLQLRLDRKSYRPGDVAKLHIQSPFGGSALVCVETDRVVAQRVIELPSGEGTQEFVVDEAWRPNVYLTATVVRPVEAEDEWRPHRASGAVQLDVDCTDRKLELTVEAPEHVRPEREIEVAVRAMTGGRPKPGTAVIIAAVDEGVLALTGHRTPSPWKFFCGARRLGVEEYDMFSRLAPELAAWRVGKRAEPGGDGGAEQEESEFVRRLSPIQARRVRTAVLYAGALTTGEDGLARARFKLPEYLGELRLMAWAANGAQFGSTEKPLPVKSPIMARASWPRFLAPGDEFELPVTVFNRTAGNGAVKITLSSDGPLHPSGKLSESAEVPAGGERTVRLSLCATGVGKISARVTASLGNESYRESVEIPVRPAVAFARTAGSMVIAGPGEKRVTVGGDFIPGTDRCSVVFAASPVVELTGALHYLLEYPYGCVEQTTSKMVPLVYLRDLAELARPQSVGSEEIEEMLRAGFVQLHTMQTHCGGLATWPGGSSPYPWGSLYAADLLVEARKAGYEVPKALLDPLLEYVQSKVQRWASSRDGKGRPDLFGHAAYACYVLARAGRPAYAWMARLEEVLRESDKTKRALPVTARFHLAAAYLAAGQRKAAKSFVALARPAAKVRQAGGYLGSPVREAAVMLSVLLDLDAESPQIPALAHRLKTNLRLGAWGTTQENAFALQSLGKYARRLGVSPEAEAAVTLPDGSTRKFQAREGLLLDQIGAGQSVRVKVEGNARLYAFWHAEGIPKQGQAIEEDSGISIRRTFLAADGKSAADPADLVQGRLYQVRLAVTADRSVSNLVITDLLAAGLEVENPNLRGSARREVQEGRNRLAVDHVERRDDRVLVFGRLRGGRSEFRYVVRAVTAGTFVLPAAEVSCMYDPALYSVHGQGTVRIRP